MALCQYIFYLLWLIYCEKYRKEGEFPYQLTQVKKYYRDYAVKTNATMHLNHKPGEIMQVDWRKCPAWTRCPPGGPYNQ